MSNQPIPVSPSAEHATLAAPTFDMVDEVSANDGLSDTGELDHYALDGVQETNEQTESKKEIDFFETEEKPLSAPPHVVKKTQTKSIPIPKVRDPLTLRIEQIMEDNLGDVYKELTPIQQQEFRIQGETTARAIRTLMKQTKIKMREIFKLLYDWLKLLPGINHFFLEQEAKIKADKILGLKKQDSLEF